MLDVHPPHEAAHTWKDFFIHIATICIGLLIAVGLEQTVEAIHHARERRELISDIHRECESNLKIADADVLSYDAARDWTADSAAAIEDVHPSGGLVTVILPPRKSMDTTQAPSNAVWSVAKSSGKVALLPENLAEIYDRMDHVSNEFLDANRQTNYATQNTSAVAARLRVQVKPGSTVHLSVDKADELAAALADSSARENASAIWSAYWSGSCRAVLDGVQSRDAMYGYMERKRAVVEQKRH